MSILLHRFIMSCALQIDGSVELVLTDEQLRFYLPAYGDRMATIAWLNSNGGNGTEFRPQSPLLSRLRLKIEKRNTLRAASCATTSTADRTWTKAISSERRIELGWLHFSKGKYRQVRTANGGGTQHLPQALASTPRPNIPNISSFGTESLFTQCIQHLWTGRRCCEWRRIRSCCHWGCGLGRQQWLWEH